MKQKLIDGDKMLWEISNTKNPIVWEVGRKYDPQTDSHFEVNRKPNYGKAKRDS